MVYSGQLPVLEVDGHKICQSRTIASWGLKNTLAESHRYSAISFLKRKVQNLKKIYACDFFGKSINWPFIRFAAKSANLLGKNDMEQIRADMMVESLT